MKTTDLTTIKTLGALQEYGYQSKTLKDELRHNLILTLKKREPIFQGILGYEDTVIPDLERGILSRHNINLLGLRGQAKTRIARQMIDLLDEYIPVVQGSELNDDPLNPISRYALDLIAEQGVETPITWMHRADRYSEKLATPDVTVADLIGDVDPIKAANLKLSYSDERVIHFGLIPRSNRCIFVINELPDLQPRIQVALFNILQEGDIQIRGFKLRLPLDIQFVFTANPEDYTNRGAIITPLKDRIESQILTHYPKSVAISKQITLQEADITGEQHARVQMSEMAQDLVEQVAFEARHSEYVDQKSGVSARLTISAYENLVSTAERRVLINREEDTHIRVSDFWGLVPAITGKIELVYEGEQEGSFIVAQNLINQAIRTQFAVYFPNPEKLKKKKEPNPYQKILDWFGQGHVIDQLNDQPNEAYAVALKSVPGLESVVVKHFPNAKDAEKLYLMEFVLNGLAAYSQLSKNPLVRGHQFKDLLSSVFSFDKDFGEGDPEFEN